MPHSRSVAVSFALAIAMTVPAVAQTVWLPRNPVTQTTSLTGITWTGTQLVAVGDAGTIVTSSDAVTWTAKNSGTSNGLYAVAKDGGSGSSSRVVAVGVSGTIRLSTNGGNSWTSATTPGAVMYAVTWAGNRFVAVGAAGAILTSDDGSTWVAQVSPATQNLNGIAWNGSLLMAVGDGGTAYTSPDGQNWTSHPSGVGSSLLSVAWAGGVFVAVGQSGVVRTTPDGTTWTPHTSDAGTLLAIAQGSKLVAVGNAGMITSSPDGASWSAQTVASVRFQGITWMGTKFVAVGQSGLVMTSTDGDNWIQTSSSRAALNAVASSGTRMVAVGDGGTIVTSDDGIQWLVRASGTTNNLYGVAWSGTRFVAVGNTGTIRTSEDGVTWTPRTSPQSSSLSAVIWTGTEFLAVSSNSYGIASPDGLTWSQRSSATGNAFYALTPTSFSTGLVAVGTNGSGGPVIRTSTNAGGSWLNRSASAAGSNILYGVAANSTTAVAVGAGGIIVTSANGSTWSPATSGVGTVLYGVTWTGSAFVAVGVGGVVLTSVDGASWAPQNSGVATGLNAVSWNGSLVLAVGAGGTVLTSSPTALPTVPDPLTPSAGDVGVPVNPYFSWSGSGGGTSYTLQVSASSGFSTLLIDTTVTGTSLLRGPLAVATQYFWRVRANGGTGNSDWSAATAFTTTPTASAAPTLASPAAAAADVPVSTTLSWNAYTAADSYRVQVSTDPSFATTIINDSVTGTSRILGGLSTSTTYSWRVYARLPSGVTAWSTVRQFTTTAPTPPTPTLASPANGATSVPLTASLTWNASAGASSYRVQVSTVADFSVIFKDSIVAGATSMTLPGLAVNGSYYWRVRAQNASGNSAFSAGRSFTTATAVPDVPVPASPAAGALDVSVYAQLTWAPAAGVVTYRLQLSTSSTFATTIVDTATLTGTTFNPGTLTQTTTYYWRLSATNPVGTSAYSPTRSFTTGLAPTGPPDPPALLAPDQFATGLGLNPTLSWNPSASATSYRVQVSSTLDFATTLSDDSLAGTSRTVGPLSGSSSYYWRVRASNQLGTGAWSEVRLFSTSAVVPDAPSLTAPEQFATGVVVSPTLSWAAVPGATSYRVQVSTGSDFATFSLNDSLAATTRALGPLADNTDYYWRARAMNAAGVSAWSSIYRFTTGTAPIPGVPVLLTPAQFADSVPRDGVALTWSPVTGATSYRVQLSASNAFASLLLDDSLATSTTRNTGALSAHTIYYWRVLAKNATGAGEFSTPFRFTTDGPTSILSGRILTGGSALTGSRLLRFALPAAARVTVRVYDTRGHEVALVVDEVMPAGEHEVAMPAALRAGVHLLDFRAGDYRAVVKTAP